MTLKTTLAALVLAVAPSFAVAMCWDHAPEQAMSCAEGQVYDAEAGACVDQALS